MSLSTRFLESQDFDRCVEIFQETFSRPPWNERWESNVVRARLKQILETPHSFGLIVESEFPVGFALGFLEPWHHGSHFYLKEMCIHPDFQRQGLGSHLMRDLMAYLKQQNAQRIYLLTARGDASENFYNSLGFYTSPKMILMGLKLE